MNAPALTDTLARSTAKLARAPSNATFQLSGAITTNAELLSTWLGLALEADSQEAFDVRMERALSQTERLIACAIELRGMLALSSARARHLPSADPTPCLPDDSGAIR
jgi:hypothetical protein